MFSSSSSKLIIHKHDEEPHLSAATSHNELVSIRLKTRRFETQL
jgi:hypothetical protein